MIAVKRALIPKTLQDKAEIWTRELLNLRTKIDICDKEDAELVKLKQKYKVIEAKYQHRTIKNTLKGEQMFQGKCAFCESFILHIDYGHIEHYRPKSKFPEYTFEWENLLLACGVCNGKQFKGDKFPIIDASIPAFINPCNDIPSEHFKFDYDINTGLAGIYGKTNRGEITEIELGLNRPELIKYRSNFVKKLVFLALKASEDNKAQVLLEEACKQDQPYSAFAIAVREKFLYKKH